MGGILLNDSGRKKFITAFEEKLESTIKHKKINRNVSYRRLIRMELYKLEKHLMDEEDLTYVKGTTVMSSKEGNKQGTFTEKYILPYALIAFHGVLNERAAENQSLNLTEEDVNKMIKGLWYGTKNLMSNSKMGHMPRLLIEVEYNEKFFHIGELDKLITYVSDKEDIKIRDIKDGYIEVSSIIDKFNTYSDKIKSIRVMKNDRVIIKYNGENIDLINKLKEININVENIEC
jgi:CRISPR-associated protein Csh2